MMLLDDLRSKQRLYSQDGTTPRNLLAVILADGTLATALFRLQGALVRWRLKPLAFLVHLVNKWVNGCVLGLGAQFGPGLVLIHPIGVVINSSVAGGRNIWIESGVVIGENRGRSPRLGSDIFIGSGAKIVGGIDVGDGARVGANAVVLHDVGARETVVGIPAKPVRKH